MKELLNCYKTLKQLDEEYNRKISKGWTVKETHVSQSPYDQPYIIVIDPEKTIELHLMVGYPINKKKEIIRHYNKELEEKQKKKKKHRKSK
jgi:hypothetical protein